MNNITKALFGKLTDGTEIIRYTLSNQNGMKVSILNFGGAIQQILVPDARGRLGDVVCGYDNLIDYVEGDGYQGALIGRFGNRIAHGQFTLNGKSYTLFQNNNGNHLHGGKVGFSHRVWSVAEKDCEEPELILHLVSPDGDEGYPGTLDICVTYRLTSDNALSIRYVATTDAETILNLTNHSYFNLGGFASGTAKGHVLYMDADRYVRTDDKLIPTGEIASVEGTPFDFRTPKTIGKDFDAPCQDLIFAGGYDHCLCFTPKEGKAVTERICVYEPESGREMRVLTNQPCVQFYTGNFLTNKEHPFKGGYPQGQQNAFCLETQHMPDSINHPNFTDVTLKPGEVYDYTTVYRFDVRK
ncbi:MAG: galactose mutarotase [Clostridia bacterium]|nr:galactose mutarotase [Clostridia bacterium]